MAEVLLNNHLWKSKILNDHGGIKHTPCNHSKSVHLLTRKMTTYITIESALTPLFSALFWALFSNGSFIVIKISNPSVTRGPEPAFQSDSEQQHGCWHWVLLNPYWYNNTGTNIASQYPTRMQNKKMHFLLIIPMTGPRCGWWDF